MREILLASLKSGSGVGVSLVLGAIAIKLMALVLGPGGVGLFSLVRQTHQTAVAFGTLNGQTALVQGISSRKGATREEYVKTVFWMMLASGMMAAAALFACAPATAHLVFNRTDSAAVSLLRWLALAVLMSVALAYLSGVLNAYRAIGRLAIVHVSSTAAMALLAYPVSLLVRDGTLAAFSWLIAATSATAAATALAFAYSRRWLRLLSDLRRNTFSREAARHFVSMAGTMMLTGLIGTSSLLAVRALVTHEFGLLGAGVFDVAWTISMTYISVVLTSFSTYYLPTLSATSDCRARVTLMARYLRLTVSLATPLIVAAISLKPLVVAVLYSEEFIPAVTIMSFMLVGDYLKVTSWVLAMPMLAFWDMRTFFWTETAWNAGFLALAFVMVHGLTWLPGLGAAFALLYFGYLMYTLRYTCSRYQLRISGTLAAQWTLGLVLVVAASVHTWSHTYVHWATAMSWTSMALALSASTLSRNERSRLLSLLVERRPKQV